MSIRQNIERIMERVHNGDVALGTRIQNLAVAATKSGIGSPEWETFMKLFAQNPEELSRLLATDGTANDQKFDLARARLVSNALGGPETIGFQLIVGVDNTLDFNLSGDSTIDPEP